MHPTVVGVVVFACCFGGALFGIAMRERLPEHHLDPESRETVKLGVGLIATMTALVLGLVTASAKSAFDELDATVKHTAGDVMSLDRLLARYGPEAAELRLAIVTILPQRIDLIWKNRGDLVSWDNARGSEGLATRLHALKPQNDDQRWLQSRAEELGEEILESRWMLLAALGSSIPLPFLAILVFWLTVTFASFGLFAPRNPTVIATFLVCALSMGAAVFLVLELDGPFEGLIRVSPEPLEYAIAHMNK